MYSFVLLLVCEGHLQKDVGKFSSDAAPGPVAKGTQEVLMAFVPAYAKHKSYN